MAWAQPHVVVVETIIASCTDEAYRAASGGMIHDADSCTSSKPIIILGREQPPVTPEPIHIVGLNLIKVEHGQR